MRTIDGEMFMIVSTKVKWTLRSNLSLTQSRWNGWTLTIFALFEAVRIVASFDNFFGVIVRIVLWTEWIASRVIVQTLRARLNSARVRMRARFWTLIRNMSINISQMVKVKESSGFPIERQKASLESITQAAHGLIGTGEFHHREPDRIWWVRLRWARSLASLAVWLLICKNRTL